MTQKLFLGAITIFTMCIVACTPYTPDNNQQKADADKILHHDEAPENPDVLVSQFGFGPFPDVPKDYDNPREYTGVFRTVEGELMARVRLRLWKQGIRDIKGMCFADGKIYINHPDLVHASMREIVEKDGDVDRTTVVLGKTVSDEELKQIRSGKTIPGLQVLDVSEGIDPYKFLGLKRRKNRPRVKSYLSYFFNISL